LKPHYYVIGHFHYVLMGALAFGIFVGIYYEAPKSGKIEYIIKERIEEHIEIARIEKFHLSEGTALVVRSQTRR